MKTIRVGFSYYPGGILSWIIRFCTKSQVSHAYVRFVDEERGDDIFQASGMQVNVERAEDFKSHSVIVEEYDVEVSDEQYELTQLKRSSEIGKPYSVLQVVGFIWVLSMRQAANRKVRNPFSNGNHAYVCVELVADCIGLNQESESMTPEDLRRWCRRNAKLVG